MQRKNAPDTADIEEIEIVTGLKLSDDYKRVYLACSGLKKTGPNGPRIDVIFSNGFERYDNLQSFVTLKDVREQWDCIGYIKEAAEHFEVAKEFVEPEFLVPIGELYDSAIYIAVGGRHAGSVYLVDNGDFGIGRVAKNVEILINVSSSDE